MLTSTTDSASNPTPAGVYEDAGRMVNTPLGIDTTGAVQPQLTGQGLSLAALRECNPEYAATYWRRLRAFYRGGSKLLRDDALMKEVFPSHRDEIADVYAERKKRAYYVPYAGEIVDHIIAALTAEPLVVAIEEKKKEGAPPAKKPDDDPATAKKKFAKPTAGTEATPLPQFYKEFCEDCSAPGGEEMSVNQLVRQAMLEALQVKRAWIQYDTPRAVDATGAPKVYGSRGEQERDGSRDVYIIPLEAETVIDWEKNAAGELQWVMTHFVEQKRNNVRSSRSKITERWRSWDAAGWEEWAITYDKQKPPRPDDIIPRVDAGMHTHGKVPFRLLEVPDGLWVMEKLDGLAREHFNKRSGLSWAEFQSLFSELYEFLGPEGGGAGAAVGANQEDDDRALSQKRGQGYVQTRGAEDDAKFIGPDSGPFTHALESCKEVRDEMHRVTHQMKLSVDNSAAALQRSGESKAHDKAAETVVLTFLGMLCRDFLKGLMQDVAQARKETDLAGEWKISGMEKFDEIAAGDTIDNAVALETVSIPSATFKRLHALMVARVVLGDTATEEDYRQIAIELEETVTDDQFDPAAEANDAEAQRQHELALKATVPGGKPGGGGAPPKKESA